MPSDSPYPIEADAILVPLENLLETFINKIDRVWPPAVPAQPAEIYLTGFIAIGRNYFRTIRYICADRNREKDLARKLEYTKSAPALARVLVEIFFNAAFMLEDLPTRAERYEKAIWKEMREHVERLEQEFGKDPDWQEPIAARRRKMEEGIRQFGITPEEVANPKLILRWPKPREMRENTSTELREFLDYLNTWFYGSLSEDAHVKGLGFMRAFAGLVPTSRPDVSEAINRHAMGTMGTAAAVLTSLLSEIQLSLRFDGQSERLKSLWILVIEVASLSQGLYDRRYRDRL